MIQIQTKGRIGEFKVIIKLLEKGFNVFENVNDIAGMDLVIVKDKIYKTIQVKTADSYQEKTKTYNFRFGNSGNNADYTICVVKEGFYIIPKKIITNKVGFQINPNKNSLGRYRLFKERWTLLNGEEEVDDMLKELFNKEM